MKLKTVTAMTAALMIGTGGTTTVEAKEDLDRGSRREVHNNKNNAKRAQARRNQDSHGPQFRGAFGGPRGPMASGGHQGPGGPKGPHVRGGQKGQPRGNKARRDGQGSSAPKRSHLRLSDRKGKPHGNKARHGSQGRSGLNSKTRRGKRCGARKGHQKNRQRR